MRHEVVAVSETPLPAEIEDVATLVEAEQATTEEAEAEESNA